MAPEFAYDVSLSIFCQNEAARLGRCIASVAASLRDRRAHLTAMVNGSRDGSAAIALRAMRDNGLSGRVYGIPHGDKSNAINHTLYDLRQPASLEVFLDGYSVIAPQAVAGLERALAENPTAVAATGVAGNGRTMMQETAATLQSGGRLHGQLHAFRPDFLDRLTAAGLRLPVGLYRGDGLLGSMACHDLDPIGNPWDSGRIKGAAEAVYDIPPLSIFRPGEVMRRLRRRVRQMRGRLENQAIKSVIYKAGYQALPRFADDMIASWLADHPVPEVGPSARPFMALALRQHAAARPVDDDALRPVLIGATI